MKKKILNKNYGDERKITSIAVAICNFSVKLTQTSLHTDIQNAIYIILNETQTRTNRTTQRRYDIVNKTRTHQ